MKYNKLEQAEQNRNTVGGGNGVPRYDEPRYDWATALRCEKDCPRNAMGIRVRNSVTPLFSLPPIPFFFLEARIARRGRYRVTALRLRIEDLDHLCEIGQRSGQPVDLVHDHGIDQAMANVLEQPLQCRSLHSAAYELV
jgi:hypothetical protein